MSIVYQSPHHDPLHHALNAPMTPKDPTDTAPRSFQAEYFGGKFYLRRDLSDFLEIHSVTTSQAAYGWVNAYKTSVASHLGWSREEVSPALAEMKQVLMAQAPGVEAVLDKPIDGTRFAYGTKD